ncbi:MAG TPA: helix-turn-helix transcriptional regulator [Solirubrobacterales bacterium]|jgi:transcriptional regulator with XRE-family HTH domain|nr:helix-turn-helix transcriptional regulator [Solirubrobacterales bacterium]
METFGAKLVALREARGWSRNRLHQQSGVAYSYLAAVEADEWLPGRDRLEQIVKALGPDASYLLDERDRLEYERMGLDPDSTVLLKDISDDMTDRDRRDLLAIQQRIKDRQRRRSGSGSRGVS